MQSLIPRVVESQRKKSVIHVPLRISAEGGVGLKIGTRVFGKILMNPGLLPNHQPPEPHRQK